MVIDEKGGVRCFDEDGYELKNPDDIKEWNRRNRERDKQKWLKIAYKKGKNDITSLKNNAEHDYGEQPKVYPKAASGDADTAKPVLDALEKKWQDEMSEQKPVVTGEHIAEVVNMWTGIPVTRLASSETERLVGMEDELKSKVIGQDESISLVSKAVRRARAGLKNIKRPTGIFMFLGPTGVGKTYLVQKLSEFMFGSEDTMLRLDMSEFMERHSVSRLVGAPPGYIGYNKGGGLTERVRRCPYSVVLFDEIEKAHPDVLHILLQILDEGKVTDGRGKHINFKNTVVVMTTNTGAGQINSPLPMGFATPTEKEKTSMGHEKALEEIRKQFKPEFINRIDEIAVFTKLSQDHIRTIIDINFSEYVERIRQNYDITVVLEDSAADLFLKEWYREKYGVRELNRTRQRLFETKLADVILSDKYKSGDTVICTASESELKFRKKPIRGKRQRS